MERYTLTAPCRLRCTVALPASKSISNRALVIYALSGFRHLPDNLGDCDDTAVMMRALESMPEVIDIKAAGTAMRFMTALLSASGGLSPLPSHLLTGTERMKHRPIKVLVDGLRHLGADIRYAGAEGFPPLRIVSRSLEGGTLELSGSVSSQFISALLLIGPVLRKGLTLRLTGAIVSRPYIDLTLWTMREFGAHAEWTSVDTIEVKAQPYVPRPYLVENDWSAASYWYEMVALSTDAEAEVRLTGLMDGSKQGDSTVRYIFSLLGVRTAFDDATPGVPTTVTLRKSGHCVRHLDYDFTNAPDLAQTVVCACCGLGVSFRFTGLQTLKIKETDRIEALKAELGKLGFGLEDAAGGRELSWDGKRRGGRQGAGAQATATGTEPPVYIDTYEDHRMALAFAPLSLVMPIGINAPHVVSKSYPHFWRDIQDAGFGVSSCGGD